MATSLIIPRKRGRSVNYLGIAAMIALVILIIGFGIYMLVHVGQSVGPAPSGGPNAAPTQPRTTSYGSDTPHHFVPDESTARTTVMTSHAVVVSTPVPVTVRTQPAAAAPSVQGNPDAIEAQRKRVEDMQKESEARAQRIEDASKSMGAIAIAEPSDSVGDNTSDQVQSQSSPMEYAAPTGPVLPIGAKIPITLSQALNSTFTGQFEVDVAADVTDETGRVVLIPHKSQCYGTTTAGGVAGQDRIYGEVTLCKFPDRTRLAVDKFPLVDADGATGLKARVDDHGAGRHRGGILSMPGILAGSMIPGVGGMVASTAMSSTGQAGHAIPGPTLYVDATPQHPRTAAILVMRDTLVGGLK